MMLKPVALALAALQCVAGLRFAMYIDELVPLFYKPR